MNSVFSKTFGPLKFLKPNVQTDFVHQKSKDVIDNRTKSETYMNYRNPTTPILQDPALHREDVRLATFDGRWTVPFIDKHKLAMFGFYYIGPEDKVKCFFCRVEIGLWVPEDNVLTEHLRWGPYCGLINRKQTNNIPINAELLNSLLPEPSFDVCGHGVRIRQSSYAEGSDIGPRSQLRPSSLSSESIDETSPRSSLLGSPTSDDSGSLNYPKRNEHPEFALESQRLKSFEDWPKTIRQKPEQLSDAGFYYTGKGDRVCCFSCGGGLKDWEENDQPWEQHAMWYSKCEYLKLMKGKEYIAAVLERKQAASTSSDLPSSSPSGSQDSGCNSQEIGPDDNTPSPASSSTSTLKRQLSSDDEGKKQANESRLCKICFEVEYNTAFFPCGHVVACGKCASSVTKCPCCRQTFTNVMRVYFS